MLENSTQGVPRSLDRDAVKSTVSAYKDHFGREETEQRAGVYDTITNQYYQLATDFYEFGWGRSFHFAQRRAGESFRASLERHQTYIARKLGLQSGDRVIDLGCGVGGPMRHIASLTGAKVTGVNINAYQVDKARKYHRQAKLEQLCDVIESDFLSVPREDASFDAVYAIEATCHAPDKVSIYSEAARLLKPGGLFAAYEWCVTPMHDEDNAKHRELKLLIERGNGIAGLATFRQVQEGLEASGFEIVELSDLATGCDTETPWYQELAGGDLSVRGLPRTPVGRAITNASLKVLEALKLAPEGTREVSTILNEGADALVESGRLGIFTPMYFFLARKK
jgi:sterol 24-C-methyltransferase